MDLRGPGGVLHCSAARQVTLTLADPCEDYLQVSAWR